LLVKDQTRPVAVADKGVTVSLSDKKVWVDAKTFDEGSWDNCGVNLLLARRTDWYEACVDLCDKVEVCAIGDHHDTLWQSILESDKHLDEIEAHYAKALAWLKEDHTACSELVYNGWIYDLMKYATLECIDHPYAVDEAYFQDLMEALFDEVYGKFCAVKHPFDCTSGTTMANGHGLSEEAIENFLDQTEQIGGGWSDAVPFSCADACRPVTVEILVMDYWCNWSKSWTEVWVEDKTPVEVVKDVVDGEISCKTYRDARYAYPGELHPVSIDYIVEQARTGEPEAYDLIDIIFGGYCKAWVDPYGNYVDASGAEIICDISYPDSMCQCSSWYDLEQVYDEHLGYTWDSVYRDSCWYEDTLASFQKGIIAVNCSEHVYCEPEVWVEFDHCGQGYLFRKWKIWSACLSARDSSAEGVEASADESSIHNVDTIYRHQRIWVGNSCPLQKQMFDVPGDVEVISCGIEYDPAGSGNVVGAAGPDQTGIPKLKDVFDGDCRLMGIGHQDKVYQVVGGQAACYKIIRTWYFADWCGGKPSSDLWWKDRMLVEDSCVQKIIIRDTLPPVCSISGPVADGGTIEAGGCYYNLEVEVLVTDICGLIEYDWELKDISGSAPYPVDNGQGSWNGEDTARATIVVEDLSTGNYLLKVRVRDECQNESYCDYQVEIIAGKKPTPICVTSLTAELTPMDMDQDGVVDTAMAVVWAQEFDQSSTAPCGESDDSLAFYIEILNDGSGNDDTLDSLDADSIIVDCRHVGRQQVRLWVKGENGTYDYCDVLLEVQNNGGGCPPSQQVTTPLGEGTDFSVDQQAGERGFELYQNRPNPFRLSTVVGFELPEAMEATITVYDVTGKVLRAVEGDFGKGYNQVEFKRTEFDVQGTLFYQLDTKEFSATRRMVIID
jgi:hypothetical protein